MEKRVNKFNALAGAAFGVAIMLAGSTSSFAAAAVSHPAPVAKAATVDGSMVVAKRGRNAAIAAGIVAGAVGAAIIASEAAKAERRRERRRYRRRHRPVHVSPEERCANNFRSFRFSDGTYQPYGGGPRELCPYLY